MKNSLTNSLNLTINVSLCSNVSRRKANIVPSHPGFNTKVVESRSANCQFIGDGALDRDGADINRMPFHLHGTTRTRLLSPPTWAVSARGESRLEPIGETLIFHTPVDLTTKSFYRVGRSEGCDIMLFHRNSSRQHALIFHHPDGSCYIVDCGSAQGTYVNGVKLPTPINSSNEDETLFNPCKVKNGSLIRFGGSGCPSYILKSFLTGIDTSAETQTTWTSHDVKECDETSVTNNTNAVHYEDDPSPISSAQLNFNTRINAAGSSSSLKSQSNHFLKTDGEPMVEMWNTDLCSKTFQLKKRSLSEYDLAQIYSKPSEVYLESNSSFRTECGYCAMDMKNVCGNQSISLSPCLKSNGLERMSSVGSCLRLYGNYEELSSTSGDIAIKRRKHVQFSDEIPSFIYSLTVTPEE